MIRDDRTARAVCCGEGPRWHNEQAHIVCREAYIWAGLYLPEPERSLMTGVRFQPIGTSCSVGFFLAGDRRGQQFDVRHNTNPASAVLARSPRKCP